MRFLTTVVAALLQAGVPGNLEAPAGEVLVARVHASGDQVYACNGEQWTLSGPDARLFDEAGRQVGTHFAGPTWQWSDGSRVMGKVVANATPDTASVPWLLLKASEHTGEGMMSQVSTIQRLHTKGGKAPAAGCDAEHKGSQTRSHYTADYYFYRPGK